MSDDRTTPTRSLESWPDQPVELGADMLDVAVKETGAHKAVKNDVLLLANSVAALASSHAKGSETTLAGFRVAGWVGGALALILTATLGFSVWRSVIADREQESYRREGRESMRAAEAYRAESRTFMREMRGEP